jgi:hypothetical protein
VGHHAYKFGLRKQADKRNWTEEEKEFIKSNYKKIPTKEISLQLNRTVESIITTAGKLGLSVCNGRPWSEDELNYLKKNYGKILLDKMVVTLNRNKRSITIKASKLNITKKRKTK